MTLKSICKSAIKKRLTALTLFAFFSAIFIGIGPCSSRPKLETKTIDGWLIRERNLCESANSGQPCACVALLHEVRNEAPWLEFLENKEWPNHARLFLFTSGNFRGNATDIQSASLHLPKIMASLCKDWIVIGERKSAWLALWTIIQHPEFASKLLLIAPEGLSTNKTETAPPFLNQKLRSIRAHSLILVGKNDRVSLPEMINVMSKEIPDAKLELIQDCGSSPHQECPGAVIAAFRRLLEHGVM